jgi:preprotein translocase subunit YajC
MTTTFASLFFAADQQQGNPLSMFLPMIIIFVLFYFMLIRPQRRQQKEHQLKLAALRSGDEVVTAGGIHGLITNVAERTVTLKIADNVKIKIERHSVQAILKKADEPETEPAPYAGKDDAPAEDKPMASKSA